jgi:DNA/RNA-binding protein KIN17
MREDEEHKGRVLAETDERMRKQYKAWLHVGCIVKVVNKTVADGALYRSKASVDAVIAAGFGAECTVDVGGVSVKAVLDQDDLETTVPKTGRRGMIVCGAARGARCTVLEVRKTEFQCDVRVEDGPLKGTVLTCREYEDVCRLVGE